MSRRASSYVYLAGMAVIFLGAARDNIPVALVGLGIAALSIPLGRRRPPTEDDDL